MHFEPIPEILEAFLDLMSGAGGCSIIFVVPIISRSLFRFNFQTIRSVKNQFTTRLSISEDKEQIEELLEASYPTLMAPDYETGSLAKALPIMLKANVDLLVSNKFYVALSTEGLCIGCGGWSWDRPSTGECINGLVHIRHFATHPNWLGIGVGRRLFELCLDAAQAAGAQMIECNSSLTAEGFYRSMGFIVERRVSLQMGSDVRLPSVVMRRQI